MITKQKFQPTALNEKDRKLKIIVEKDIKYGQNSSFPVCWDPKLKLIRLIFKTYRFTHFSQLLSKCQV